MNFKKPLSFEEAKDKNDGFFQVRYRGDIKNFDVEDVIGIIISGQNDKISFSLNDFLESEFISQNSDLRIILRNLDSENYQLEVNFCPLGIVLKAYQLTQYIRKISKKVYIT